MQASGGLKTMFLDRDGVRLAHVEAGPAAAASPPLVFVHGWCGDHTAFAPQIAHFAKTRRVMAVDLRGHGASDAPKQEYTIAGFADDIAWQCRQLELEKPVVVGHSMGGMVSLELAARHMPKAVVMIDSSILWSAAYAEGMRQRTEVFKGPDYLTVLTAAFSNFFLDTDDPTRKQAILNELANEPKHVVVSWLVNLGKYDAEAAAKACTAPVAYIGTAVPFIEMGRDLERFRALCPQLVVAKTLGSGHFSPLEVPDQINAMLERFLATGIGG
jgi:pimeloyl-ACP methyl ester carboxylesterase